MGRRGPKPASGALQFTRGETRPSRVNRSAPDLPAFGSMEPPSDLAGAGLVEWRRLAPALIEAGVLLEADRGAFEDLCRAISWLRTVERKGKAAGVEKAIATGLMGAAARLRTQVAQLRSHFGLTPVSRSSVKAKVPKVKGKLEQFIRRRACR